MARLSPKTGADTNRLMAYQATNLTDKQVGHIHAANDFLNQASATKDPVEKEKLKAAALDHRDRANLHGTPLNLQTIPNISKSLRNFHGETTDPLGTNNLGHVKIYDFGNTIANPDWHRQTVDTHWAHAAHGRIDIPYKTNIGLGAQGRYNGYQQAGHHAFAMASRKGIIDPREVNTTAFMAGGWHGQIQAKLDGNPNARQARRADMTRTGNFLQSASAHLWDPSAHGQRPLENYFRIPA
jgi:hypothetical protein